MFCALPAWTPTGNNCSRVQVPEASVQFEAPLIEVVVVNPMLGTVVLLKTVMGQGRSRQVGDVSLMICAAWGMTSLMREWWPLKINCAGATPFQLWESGNWKTTRASTPGRSDSAPTASDRKSTR